MTLQPDTLDTLFELQQEDWLFFELIIRRVYEHLVSPGDTVVDGGACGGLHTFPLADRVGPGGRVHAVEARHSAAVELERQVAQKAKPQITIHDLALANETGVGDFVCVTNMTSRSGIRELDLTFLGVPVELETVKVRLARLDDILANEASWRFCKLDLEGGEYHALLGAHASMSKHKPFITLENGRHIAATAYEYTKEDWFALFDQMQYDVFDLFGRPFAPSNWHDRVPWYCMAVARGSRDAAFVTDVFPKLLAGVTEEAGKPSDQFATRNWWNLQPYKDRAMTP